MKIGEETYPAMAIETIRVLTEAPSYQIKAGDAGIIAIRDATLSNVLPPS